MEAKAIAKYIRISPQKVKLVVDLVRGKKVEDAETILTFTTKKAAPIVKKVLKSAKANATQNPNIDEKILYVKAIFVGPGPTLKRGRRGRRGESHRFEKEESHYGYFRRAVRD
jgi:large subunit ribosomal protein L22